MNETAWKKAKDMYTSCVNTGIASRHTACTMYRVMKIRMPKSHVHSLVRVCTFAFNFEQSDYRVRSEYFLRLQGMAVIARLVGSSKTYLSIHPSPSHAFPVHLLLTFPRWYFSYGFSMSRVVMSVCTVKNPKNWDT